jgi:hypothetical protein
MITLSENTGRSFEDAIVISGAMNTEEGIAAEYDYLVKKFGIPDIDWFFIKQMLIPQKDKYFDKFLLKDNHDNEFEIYFNISNFFGK